MADVTVRTSRNDAALSGANLVGFIGFALQALAWHVVKPSAWAAYIHNAAPDLSPAFCLAHLRDDRWKRPAILRAILASCIFAPLLGASLTVSSLVVAGRLQPTVFIGVALGIATSLVFSAVVNLPAGACVGVVAPVAFGIVLSRPDVLLIDFMLTSRLGPAYGAISLIAIYATGNVARRAVSYSSPRQIGGVVIGLTAGAGLIALIVNATTSAIDGGLQARDSGAGIQVPTALIPALCLGLAAYLRTSRLANSVLICAVAFVALLAAYGGAGREFGREPDAHRLLLSVLAPFVAVYLVLFTLPFAFVERIGGAWAGVIAGALGSLGAHWAYWRIFDLYALQPNVLIAAVLTVFGMTMQWWRPLLFYPFEAAVGTILLQTETRRRWDTSPLRWHPAFWDEGQWLPIYGLDAHILLLSERDEDEGRRWINEVAGTRQRWAAQAAQVELDARRLEACATADDIAAQGILDTPFDLQGKASALLANFGKIANDVRAALNQSSNYNRQLVLRAVRGDLDALVGALTRSNEAYARRFRPVAVHWHRVVSAALNALEQEALNRREIPSPYIVGQPLTRHQEIFVGRADVSARIEALLRHDDQPPLLLYGQRRMGKTSLLFNLRWMLPNRIVPLVVDLQGPVAHSSDHAGFLYNLAKNIALFASRQSLAIEPLPRASLTADPFTKFDDWLDGVEATLVEQGRETILLALDEFESLDAAMTAGRLREDAVLSLLRHIIQYRPRFKLIFAGSHTLQEFARWSSYLINAETIHLSYLRESEATQLIERPVKDFPLAYEPEASRRVLDLTRSHPYLVQLLCAEVVALKNEQGATTRYCATTDDVEMAVPHVLERGRQFFAEIETNQLDADAVRTLRVLAANGERCAVRRDDLAHAMENNDRRVNDVLSLLTRRELIEATPDGYAFQVEVIRRWFAMTSQ